MECEIISLHYDAIYALKTDVMAKSMTIIKSTVKRQKGVAAVEFAIIAILFFTLLFGIFELGRLFYVINSVQEVTRRAAREAVVRWTDGEIDAKTLALFCNINSVPAPACIDSPVLPAGAEISSNNITVEYLTSTGETPDPFPASAADNIVACVNNEAGCIALVRVSITGATYAPMVSLFPFFTVPIPASTVVMPAESMGYTG